MPERVVPPVGPKRDEALALAMGWRKPGYSPYWLSGAKRHRRGKYPAAFSTDDRHLPELLAVIGSKGWDYNLACSTNWVSKYEVGIHIAATIVVIGGAQTLMDAFSEALLKALWTEEKVSDG